MTRRGIVKAKAHIQSPGPYQVAPVSGACPVRVLSHSPVISRGESCRLCWSRREAAEAQSHAMHCARSRTYGGSGLGGKSWTRIPHALPASCINLPNLLLASGLCLTGLQSEASSSTAPLGAAPSVSPAFRGGACGRSRACSSPDCVPSSFSCPGSPSSSLSSVPAALGYCRVLVMSPHLQAAPLPGICFPFLQGSAQISPPDPPLGQHPTLCPGP